MHAVFPETIARAFDKLRNTARPVEYSVPRRFGHLKENLAAEHPEFQDIEVEVIANRQSGLVLPLSPCTSNSAESDCSRQTSVSPIFIVSMHVAHEYQCAVPEYYPNTYHGMARSF